MEHAQQIASLTALSRSRALTELESLHLERAIIASEGRPIPWGLTRELARHGIKRDRSRPQPLHHIPNQLPNGDSPVSPAVSTIGSGAAIAQTGGPAPVSNASFHEGRNSL